MNRDKNVFANYGNPCTAVYFNDSSYEQSKLQASKNFIISSCLNTFEGQVRSRGLSLKYVGTGLETYIFQKKEFKLTQGQYLLVNENASTGETFIDTTNTWSLCVDIDLSLMHDFLKQLTVPDDLEAHSALSRYFLSDELFMQETACGDRLKGLLDSLINSLAAGLPPDSPTETLYDLTAELAHDNLPLIKSYYKLTTAKSSTRKELFRRLLQGREILDNCLEKPADIKSVAEHCCLSEFRFYRLFKQCFGTSPYNYLLHKRIEKSIALRKQGKLSWTEIALLLNFTDLPAFSNAFRKVKGVFPNHYFERPPYQAPGISLRSQVLTAR
ncbi:MAG TPA: AraC family transcriptional regulator [Sphingobacteriaceae bacterium]